MPNRRDVYRILDAAANRAREAVRVLEDAVRFLADRKEATESLKRFRHDFCAAVDRLPLESRLTHRATESDVGTSVTADGEYERRTTESILRANFCRLQESLRSLEEFTKLAEPPLSPIFERLRYRSYTLERNIYALFPSADETVRQERIARLERARFGVLFDANVSEDDFSAMIRGGVELFRLRVRGIPDRKILSLAKRLKARSEEMSIENAAKRRHKKTVPLRPLLLIDDRADMALLADFDGVHLTADGITPKEARRIVGGDLLLGLSTAPTRRLNAATLSAADYFSAEAVFSKEKKTGPETSRRPALDKAPLEKWHSFIRGSEKPPIFAEGKITPENLGAVLSARIGRVITEAEIFIGRNIEKEVLAFRRMLECELERGSLS